MSLAKGEHTAYKYTDVQLQFAWNIKKEVSLVTLKHYVAEDHPKMVQIFLSVEKSMLLIPYFG
jgi:hypothetical protein